MWYHAVWWIHTTESEITCLHHPTGRSTLMMEATDSSNTSKHLPNYMVSRSRKLIFKDTTVTISNLIKCYIPLHNVYLIHMHSVLWMGSTPKTFTLLGCYAVLIGSSLPTFGTTYRSHLQGSSNSGTAWPLNTGRIGCPDWLTLEDGTNRLSQNVSNQIPINGA